jgi:hypothetical protein
VIAFHDPTFPGAISDTTLIALLPPSARLVGAEELVNALNGDARTLVSFHGAYFPKTAWTAIMDLCRRGGNLAIFGGPPFAHPVRHDGTVEPETNAYSADLFLGSFVAIDEVPGSCEFAVARDAIFLQESALQLDPQQPGRFWAANPMLTQSFDHPQEMGSAGPIDAILQPFAYATTRAADGVLDRIATPFFCLEHHTGAFAGGRWLISAWEPANEQGWRANAAAIQRMICFAAQGCQTIAVAPNYACYTPEESPVIDLTWRASTTIHCEIAVVGPTESAPFWHVTRELSPAVLPASERHTLPICMTPGLYRVRLRYHAGDDLTMAQEQGFWIWDDALVARTGGKRLSAGRDYLYVGDQIFPLFGTTYMDSLVQRKFLRLPNPARWDHDFAAMRQEGINFIRTGIWTDWEQIMPVMSTDEPEAGSRKPEGPVPTALRALDAFIMTACAHDLQAMFTFFSFCPPLYDGENAWLDPRALRHQEAYVALLAQRYRDVETVSWDLINEPSFGPPEHIFSQRAMPARDPIESAAFRDWLRRHGDLDDVQARWRLSPAQLPDWQAVTPPEDHDYSAGVRDPTTRHMFRAQDFTHFSQDMITQWAGHLRDQIRATGNMSMVGIGQDESGSRPSPQFYGEVMDFTTTHPWWNNDDLLWDLLMDKTPDRPHLSQETGVMLVRDVDGRPFRNGVEAGRLLERKLMMSLIARSAGVIQWLWHTNAYMAVDNENNIGLVRVDGSAKPELGVMREFGRLMRAIGPLLAESEPPDVWIVAPYAQWFTRPALGIEATQRAIRALGYRCGVIPQVVNEYRLGHFLETCIAPRLIILPGIQYLSRDCWPPLLNYVRGGGRLLVSGVVTRDAYNFACDPGWLDPDERDAPPSPVSRDEVLHWRNQQIPFVYAGDKIGSVRKAHQNLRTRSIGAGIINWSGLPLELADSPDTLASFYCEIMELHPLQLPPPGLLTRRITLARDSTLLVAVSESSVSHSVEIIGGITLTVAPGRGGAALITADGQATVFGGCSITGTSFPSELPASPA